MYIVLGYLKVLLDNGWLSKFGINIYVYVFLNLRYEIYELRFKWKCGIFIGLVLKLWVVKRVKKIFKLM